MHWVEKLYSSKWSTRFSNRANSLYGHLEDWQTLAEDAASMTAMKLSTYSEQQATDALILSVFKNALTDCVRERHGFPRPRKWLESFGELGRRLFKLVCLKGQTRRQVSDWVETESSTTGRIVGDAPSVETAQALAEEIFDQMQEAQECSPWRRQMARESNDETDEGVSPFATLGDDDMLPEDALSFDQMRLFIETLVAGSKQMSIELDSQRIGNLAKCSWSELGLDDRDRLVLGAYLGRGLQLRGESEKEPTEQELADDLGLTVPQIRNRRKKALQALLKFFE